mgnify:CR=1 FL=1
MNSIFFAQNVPSNSREIRLQYNNRTLYSLQVTCSVINSMNGGTVNDISYTIPSMTLVTKTIPILSSGISINALTWLSISNAPSQFFVSADVRNVTDNNSLGTYNRGGSVRALVTSVSKVITTTFDYNSGMYSSASASQSIPEDDTGNYKLNIFNDVDETGITGTMNYGLYEQVITYGPILGNAYTHYLEIYGGDGKVSAFVNGENRGIYSLSEGARPTSIGTIALGYATFLHLTQYEASGSTPTPPEYITCNITVCSTRDLNDTECTVDVYESDRLGSTGTRLIARTYAPGEDNWQTYLGGYKLVDPSIKVTNTTIRDYLIIGLNGVPKHINVQKNLEVWFQTKEEGELI